MTSPYISPISTTFLPPRWTNNEGSRPIVENKEINTFSLQNSSSSITQKRFARSVSATRTISVDDLQKLNQLRSLAGKEVLPQATNIQDEIKKFTSQDITKILRDALRETKAQDGNYSHGVLRFLLGHLPSDKKDALSGEDIMNALRKIPDVNGYRLISWTAMSKLTPSEKDEILALIGNVSKETRPVFLRAILSKLVMTATTTTDGKIVTTEISIPGGPVEITNGQVTKILTAKNIKHLEGAIPYLNAEKTEIALRLHNPENEFDLADFLLKLPGELLHQLSSQILARFSPSVLFVIKDKLSENQKAEMAGRLEHASHCHIFGKPVLKVLSLNTDLQRYQLLAAFPQSVVEIIRGRTAYLHRDFVDAIDERKIAEIDQEAANEIKRYRTRCLPLMPSLREIIQSAPPVPTSLPREILETLKRDFDRIEL